MPFLFAWILFYYYYFASLFDKWSKGWAFIFYLWFLFCFSLKNMSFPPLTTSDFTCVQKKNKTMLCRLQNYWLYRAKAAKVLTNIYYFICFFFCVRDSIPLRQHSFCHKPQNERGFSIKTTSTFTYGHVFPPSTYLLPTQKSLIHKNKTNTHKKHNILNVILTCFALFCMY